jgi:hypothetical protein
LSVRVGNPNLHNDRFSSEYERDKQGGDDD